MTKSPMPAAPRLEQIKEFLGRTPFKDAELFPLAAKQGRFLLFEAAVGGGIPIIKSLQESLVANDIEGLACIINGTCNYILTQMARNKVSFDDALAEAQKLGYAEANPSFDIDGMDSLHKVSLLASLAYGRYVDYRKLSVEGVRKFRKAKEKFSQRFIQPCWSGGINWPRCTAC